MNSTGLLPDSGAFERDLQEQAVKLVEQLNAGDMTAAMSNIQQLNEMRYEALYREVGQLTRAVHNAIVSFTDDVSSAELLQESKKDIASISDASDRLSYVIELTESNAHKTIDQVDRSLQLVTSLEQSFDQRKVMLDEFAQLKEGNPKLEAMYEKACGYAEHNHGELTEIKECLTAILLGQEYQDITGQLIKRVIQLVTDIEDELVGMMELASRVSLVGGIEMAPAPQTEESDSGEVKAEGPQMAGASKADVATSQDDVDDLLSSLGF